jgi:hypothetical protein
MSRPGDEARQRARDIRDEALTRHAERDRAAIALLRDEIAELKSMLREQHGQIATLTAMVAALKDRPPQTQPGVPPESSSPRPLTDRKRLALERIRDLRARNLSFSAICDIFRSEGVPTLSGEGEWSKGTLWNLWKNHHRQLDDDIT